MDVAVPRGRLTVFLDHSADSLLAEHVGWKDFEELIFTNDMPLIRGIRPVENLCLGSMEKLSVLGVVKKRFLHSVEQEFGAWYGDRTLTQRTTSAGLSGKEAVALTIYRMIFKNPEFLVIKFLGNGCGMESFEILKKGISELCGNGTTVCILTGSLEIAGTFSEQFQILDDEGGS